MTSTMIFLMGIVCGFGISYKSLVPLVKQTQQLDMDIIAKNNELNERWESINNEIKDLEKRKECLQKTCEHQEMINSVKTEN